MNPMTLMDIIYYIGQIKALTSLEYEGLYNILMFLGVIVTILVMVYVLVGREPEEEE
ncbi:MAG: hypothetical protein ACTSYZ_00465 [Candidatus Helarchaeota archaeon]